MQGVGWERHTQAVQLVFLSTWLLFPKLDICAIKTIRTRGEALVLFLFFFWLLKDQKFSCPCLAEGHEASSRCAVGHNTVQTFGSDYSPYVESAALNEQCMTCQLSSEKQ